MAHYFVYSPVMWASVRGVCVPPNRALYATIPAASCDNCNISLSVFYYTSAVYAYTKLKGSLDICLTPSAAAEYLVEIGKY